MRSYEGYVHALLNGPSVLRMTAKAIDERAAKQADITEARARAKLGKFYDS